MTIILIIGIVYMVAGFLTSLIWIFLKTEDIDWTITLILYIVGILNITTYNYIITPSALDVYKGKTVLKITYEDKIPVDTVVIYKKGGEK